MPTRGPRTSLIDVVREEHEQSERERRRVRRRRIFRWVFGVLATAIVSIVVGYAALRWMRARQADHRVEVAREQLAADQPDGLALADAMLSINLDEHPDDARSLGLNALLQVHRFRYGQIAREEVVVAIERADTQGCEEAVVSEHILAALDGELDRSPDAYASISSNPFFESEVLNEQAWLSGMVAIQRPYDRSAVQAAVDRLLKRVEQAPDWVLNTRVVSALLARQNAFDRALEVVAAGRKRHPEHLGLSADEVVLYAFKGERAEGVRSAADALLRLKTLEPWNRGLVDLALARLDLDVGAYQTGVEHLKSAWSTLPEWDALHRDDAIDLALTHGEADLVRTWLKSYHPSDAAQIIYDAWLALLEGDAAKALESLAQADRENPKFARLEALALVEQRRWQEARRWLDYLEGRGIHRPELDVAAALVTAGVSSEHHDLQAASKRLQAIAELQPRTRRVWTAQAEVALAMGEQKPAREALQRAVEIEACPGLAHRRLGELLSDGADTDPKRREQALAAYRKAVDVDPWDVMHQASLGRFLFRSGRIDEAITTLQAVVARSDSSAPASVYLDLAQALSRKRLDGDLTVAIDDVGPWIESARKAGADPTALVIEEARWALAIGDEDALQSARARLNTMLPSLPSEDAVDARVVLAAILVHKNDESAARAVLRAGLRGVRRNDGSLYLALALVEVADANKRLAASLGFKAWKELYNDGATPRVLLDAAERVTQMWLAIDQPRTARRITRELTERVPDIAQAWVVRSNAELKNDNVDEGCTAAEQALSLEPEQPASIAAMGDCWTKRFNFDKARDAYAQAAKKAEGTAAERTYRRKLARL